MENQLFIRLYYFAICTIKFISLIHALHVRVTYCEEVEMDCRNLRMTRSESLVLADSQARSATWAIDQQQSDTAIAVLGRRETIFRTIVCEERIETTVLLPQTMSDA